MEPERKPGLATTVVVIVVLLLLAALLVPGLLSSQRASNERSASAILKVLGSAEADFRGNDRDGNGAADFWTGDVAGLYHLQSPDGVPIRLIPRELAEADPTHPNAKPLVGYWFVAMDVDETGQPYRQGPGQNRHPTKFAFCAYPASRASGRTMFFINEGNTIFRIPFDGTVLRKWFTDDERKAWSAQFYD
jgi:type II secretory pathway pseudopilin PulG